MKDIVFSKGDRIVNIKNRGIISLKGKFVLMRFLELLIKNRQGLSKKEITEKLWEQEYNSVIHDNRVFALINRLRKYLEKDYGIKPYSREQADIVVLLDYDLYGLAPNMTAEIL